MSGWWSRFKNFFSGGERQEEVPAEELTEVMEKPAKPAPPQKEVRQPRTFGRPQKICPFCKAPNDTFVPVCWMCKRAV